VKTFKIGDTAQLSKTVTANDVAAFAHLSLDHNPVHLDAQYAATTVFKKPIAHGLYVASLISATIAGQLPGPGSIYLEQNLSFRKPVYIGDTVIAKVTVLEFPKPSLLRLETIVVNQDGVVVIEGSALVKV